MRRKSSSIYTRIISIISAGISSFKLAISGMGDDSDIYLKEYLIVYGNR